MADPRERAWRDYRDETPEIHDVEDARTDFLAGWDAAKAHSRGRARLATRDHLAGRQLHLRQGDTP